MLTELQTGFNDLKKKIQYLMDIEKRISGLEKRSFKSNNNERRLKELALEMQDQKIEINVSGKIYTISSNFFKNSKLRSTIKDILLNQDETKSREPIFLDVPFLYFDKALEIIRKSDSQFTKELKASLEFFEADVEEENKFNMDDIDLGIDLNSIRNTNDFFEFLKDFFKSDFERVVAKFKLPYVDKDEEPNQDLTRLIKSYEISNAFEINEVLSFYLAESVKDITKKDNQKAFFLGANNGEITFKFTKNVKISSIVTKPFTELTDAWFPEFRPKILSSVDGNDWDVIYSPDQYTETYSIEETVVKIDPKLLKFIKFQSNQSVFSIAYINVSS
jgi:hypothetical protein